MEPGECSWRKEVQECGGETTEGKVGSQWKGQINSPEVTIRERNWWQKVNQNTSFAEPKLICLTCQIHASKTSCEDSFDQVTEILYEALNWISDFFFTHSHSNRYILSGRKLTPWHKMKNQGSICPSVLKKNDPSGPVTTEEGVTLFSIFVGLHYPSSPSLPGATNLVFKNLSCFFLEFERERNVLKKKCHFPLLPRPALSSSSPAPVRLCYFTAVSLAPQNGSLLCHLLRTPRLAIHDCMSPPMTNRCPEEVESKLPPSLEQASQRCLHPTLKEPCAISQDNVNMLHQILTLPPT